MENYIFFRDSQGTVLFHAVNREYICKQDLTQSRAQRWNKAGRPWPPSGLSLHCRQDSRAILLWHWLSVELVWFLWPLSCALAWSPPVRRDSVWPIIPLLKGSTFLGVLVMRAGLQHLASKHMPVKSKVPLESSLYICAFHKRISYLYPRFDGPQSRFSPEVRGH